LIVYHNMVIQGEFLGKSRIDGQSIIKIDLVELPSLIRDIKLDLILGKNAR